MKITQNIKKAALLFSFILIGFCGWAQDIIVSGTITDSTHAPLAGANVIVKDKIGLGVVADSKGRYSIKTTPYSILIFSFTGYVDSLIDIEKNVHVDMVLKAKQADVMEEVVVTAMGPQKKISVTGAITTVDVEHLKIPSANLTNALAGNVAGIIAMQTSGQPGSNQSDFWIRGISTFGASSSALVLVDGVERAFNEINVEDIASFSVLKDASATAIYGSKGANGVILITTKKGRIGKININAKSEYSYVTRTRTPEFVDGPTYAGLVNEAKTTRNKEPLYTSNELTLFKEGLDPDLYPNVDWKDVMLNEGANMYRAALNFRGGASSARYFVSGSYVNEGGMYKSDGSLKDYKTNANRTRWNYRTNVDIDITKTTLLRIGVAGYLEKHNEPGMGGDIWYSLVGQSPISIPVLYSNGLVPSYGTGNKTNPWVLTTQTGFREFWHNNSENNVALEQNLAFITKGLSAIGRVAYDNDNDNFIRRLKWPEQYNTQRRRDRNGNLIMRRVSTESLMFQESGSEGTRAYAGEFNLNYDRTFNKHNVQLFTRAFQRETRQTQNLGGDIISGIPHRNASFSGSANYGFENKYFAVFNFGYTGSENFKIGHQWGFFPAVSAAWNISEENLIKDNIKWINLFKVRYSYGEVGNDMSSGTRFPFLSTIGGGGAYNYGDNISPNSYDGLRFTQVASDNLTWEIAKKHNLGVDLTLFKNAFTSSLDFFTERREQIFMQRGHLPSMVGIQSLPWANVGIMDNKGFDGQFSYNKTFRKVQVTLRSNVTYYKNRVIQDDEEANTLPYRMTQGFRWQQARGLVALGLFKDYEEIRNSPKQTFGEYQPGDIKYKDINGDGVIDDNDVAAIGATRVPNLIYGVGASLRWKGIDFNFHFQGAGKSSYFIDGPSVYPFSEGEWGNILTDVVAPGHRWISQEISGDPATENPNAIYPRLSYGGNGNNYRASTFWIRNGAYLRLKNIELGYTLPAKYTSKFHISGARFYIMAQNLAVFDHLKLWDPELGSGNGMAYPLPKTATLGLNVDL